MKGGAVAADGRIEPGDMLLQVNDINFENMSNDDAVRVLREIVEMGELRVTGGSCLLGANSAFPPAPTDEPIQPIDPAAWVSHSAALTGAFAAYPGSSSMSTITSGSSVAETSRSPPGGPIAPFSAGFDEFNLSVHTDMASVTKAMASPESGLEVRDRMWLKITIPNAFLGSDVVDWLYHHVEGFQDRREARKYASNLLKAGFIRHTVNKITFSEQCYYVFGDLHMANLSLNDNDGSSGASDQDTLAPLPLPGATPWPLMPTFSYQYPAPHPYSTQPPPYHELSSYSYGMGSASSQHSEGEQPPGRLGSSPQQGRGGPVIRAGGAPGQDSWVLSPALRGEWGPVRSHHSLVSSLRSHHSYGPPGVPLPPPPGAPPVRDLASVPPELTASRQSFHMAMGNPSEFFVDVM
uniref:Dishevelled segment polarity protein 2 n=1 Tax=Gopherus agassizii TaxID=38772 RepID=A0A452H046_9SAUR